MLYLSIDHGTTSGYSIINVEDDKMELLECDFIFFTSETTYDVMYEKFDRLFQFDFDGQKIRKVVIEKSTFAGRSCGYNAVMKLFEIRAIIKLLAHQYGIDIVEIAPTSMKKFITENGRASKEEVAKTMCNAFDLVYETCVPKHTTKNPQFDMCDAIALNYTAICKERNNHLEVVY